MKDYKYGMDSGAFLHILLEYYYSNGGLAPESGTERKTEYLRDKGLIRRLPIESAISYFQITEEGRKLVQEIFSLVESKL
jgi:hypothetical protein